MNKAFVREPDDDGRGYCPRCGSLGVFVHAGPLETHVRPESRTKLGQTAWFCNYPPCEVAYFDLLGGIVLVNELIGPVPPKNDQVSLCACFPFFREDVEADAADEIPQRIRNLLKLSQSDAARCTTLAADGRCCLTEVKRLYMRLKEQQKKF